MFRSLRFQLPALFLAGVIVSGLVAAAIAFQLLGSYTLNRAKRDLSREAAGITRLYIEQANGSNDPVPVPQLEAATRDPIFFVPPGPGVELFPGAKVPLAELPKTAIDFAAIRRGRTLQREMHLPGSNKTWLAVVRPVNLGKGKDQTFYGGLLVAKPKDRLSTRIAPLLGRLAPAPLAA